MRSAPALEAGERILDLGLAWLLPGIEQCSRSHDPAVEAIAALRHLLLDEGLLDGVRPLRSAEAGKGNYFAASDCRKRRDAGVHRLPIDMPALRYRSMRAAGLACTRQHLMQAHRTGKRLRAKKVTAAIALRKAGPRRVPRS